MGRKGEPAQERGDRGGRPEPGLEEKPVTESGGRRGKPEPGRGAPAAEIHLFQCLLKGKKMDAVVRQAVEAGVHRIVPVASEHAVAQYDQATRQKKRRRWDAVIREAVQQSGSRVVTEVEEPADISKIPGMWNSNDPGLFFHQQPLEQSSLHRYLSQYPRRVAVAIGPEGGFSPGEIELLTDAGFLPVYLNTNVLRAETAAVYAIGAVQTILTERAFWRPREDESGSAC
jgi:16S rRNA (uracil1498-N3)-methyltransferase